MKTESWLTLASIQVGGSICLPVIMVGHVLAQNYGMWAALVAIGLGNGLLLILALAAASNSATHRMNTVDQATSYLGEHSSKCFASLMVFCLMGWFSIQLHMMTLSALQLAPLPSIIITLLLGGMMTAFVMKGLSWLGKMAFLCTPLLLIVLGGVLYSAPFPEIKGSDLFQGSSLSLVMATSIATLIDLPNFFRTAKTKRDGLMAIFLLFAIGTPLIEATGVYLAAAYPNQELLDSFKGYFIPYFLILGGWMTNNANLYSAAISSQTVCGKLSEKMRVAILGALGTLIACLNPADHLETLITTMGIAVASMGGIFITGNIVGMSCHKPSLYYPFIWIVGTSVGFYAFINDHSLTGIALLDAFGVSAILTAIKEKEWVWTKLT